MSPALLAAIYCLFIFLAALSGGIVPLWLRPSHTRTQLALSFVAGLMLGVGLLHLLPHSFFELGKIDTTVACVMAGFLLMFFLERIFHFHQHDAPVLDAAVVVPSHEHHHDHQHGPGCNHGSHDHHAREFSWGGAAVGLTLHSLIDGLALGAGVTAEWHGGEGGLLAGLGIFLAIALHKPFDTLTISTLMAHGGWSTRARQLVCFCYALVAPAGAALFFLGFSQLGESGHQALGWALGFAAGAFLCIATSDLLPELQFHSHDRIKLSVALLVGVGLAWAIVFLETSGHDVHQHPHSAEAHDH